MLLILKMWFIFGQEVSDQKRIVIDPGHGGKDFGAIAQNGLKEKDVVLDIALEVLKHNAKSETPANIYLTRYCDTLISLSDRTKLSKWLKADLFISLHCNDANNPNARGIEIYLSHSTSVHTMRSIWFAYTLQNKLKNKLGFESRGIKFADFQVLREGIGLCPAILLEIGFLSNPDERNYLMEKVNIKYIALIILSTIVNQ